MLNEGMFTSKNQDWETPDDLFKSLDNEFHFTLDPCANHQNHKCSKYYTIQEDGLSKDWSGEVVFCNPPYTPKGKIQDKWVKKCLEESKHATVVLLIPARTDTIRFHEYILPNAEIRFIKGRLRFNNSQDTAPFPSMICIFGRHGVKGVDYGNITNRI